jgi:hypothetical protein
MKYLISLVFSLLLLSACNKEEGLGGSSSLEGYVYEINHSDDNFSFKTDTFPAVKKDVYLIFGSNEEDYFGDDVETDNKGFYRFDYLNKGNYIVYSYTEYASGRKKGISQQVRVDGGTNRANPIFIHTGKAYGTAMIKGYVHASFYDKNTILAQGPAVDADVYINREGEDMFFDRIRVGDQGYFIFQKIPPGKYKVWVTSEDPITRQLTPIEQLIDVTEPEELYEFPDTFSIKVRA